jgi:amyloid beta A4 precursor protein-binding family B protein 1-interacting protein
MANLEETQESELDSILNELSLLEQKGGELVRQSRVQTHSRSSSIVSGANSTISTVTASSTSDVMRESSRTESPDNDSAFSDTVSLLSSESSASSGLSSLNNISKISSQNNSNNIIISCNNVQVSIIDENCYHNRENNFE